MTTANLLTTSSTDPFTQVYCAVWDMMEAWSGFTGLVSIPNRIKFLGDKLKPTKEIITDSDLPELCIEPDCVEPHLQANSGESMLIQKFKFYAATGNQRLDTLGPAGMNGAIFPVAWEMYRSMLGWFTMLRSLTWPYGVDIHGVPIGTNFIHLARPTTMSIGLTSANENRNIIGWSASQVQRRYGALMREVGIA